MDRAKTLLRPPRIFILLGVVLLVFLLAGGGALYVTQAHPPQPIDFPHSTHVAFGVQCIFCHTSATFSPVAGIPSNDKCWGCHQQIDARGREELEKLYAYLRNNEPIPWVPVAIQPDFVHFPHDRHVNAGVSCETCHGDVSQMRVAERQPHQNMGWCLDCHVTMRPEQTALLTDCSACHY
jgi:uncharacterized paraquat-inducible protein A